MAKRSLNINERKVFEKYIKGLKVVKRETSSSIVVAMVGLVGSGKSAAAERIAKDIQATVISGNDIRVALRRAKLGYEGAREIAVGAAGEVLSKGGNVVMDGDYVGSKKRALLKEKARPFNAKPHYVRVHADLDTVIGRIISDKYSSSKKDFYGGASVNFKGKVSVKGATVKMRELLRRTPHHYSWSKDEGGMWILKTLPFPVHDTIDTTDPKKSKKSLDTLAKVLLKK